MLTVRDSFETGRFKEMYMVGSWWLKLIMKGDRFGWLVFMDRMLQDNVWICGDV